MLKVTYNHNHSYTIIESQKHYEYFVNFQITLKLAKNIVDHQTKYLTTVAHHSIHMRSPT